MLNFIYYVNYILIEVIFLIIPPIVTLVPVIVAVAFFTLAERKIMATIQRRRGPNVVGFWGLLQPLADGLKLIIKETIVPRNAVTFLFLLSPMLSFIFGFVGWTLIPLHCDNTVRPIFFSNPNLSLLLLFAVSAFGVYGVIIGGWSSNSRYAMLGALRSAAQMISYEVSLGLTIISVVVCSGTLNLQEIVEKQQAVWYIWPLLPLVLIFFVSMLAETNRAPFDLPEAEAELVAGFNVEYSGVVFALFFLAEYSSMLLMGVLLVILFFGGWLSPLPFIDLPYFFFYLKSVFFFFMYVFVRANFPRLRYDQLMNICWKIFLPLTLGYLVFISGVLLSFNGLPVNQQGIPTYLDISDPVFYKGTVGPEEQEINMYFEDNPYICEVFHEFRDAYFSMMFGKKS